MEEKKKILIIEERMEIITLFQKNIKEDIRMIPVKTETMVMKFLEKNRPDLVFINTDIPMLDIERMTELIQKSSPTGDIPIILLSDEMDIACIRAIMNEKIDQMLLNDSKEKLIDPEAGVLTCGSEETYRIAVQEYIHIAKDEMQKIQYFCDVEDIANYTIKVHALKNSSRLIGAVTLSEEALKMERYGREGKKDKISEQNLHLLQLYKQVVQELQLWIK